MRLLPWAVTMLVVAPLSARLVGARRHEDRRRARGSRSQGSRSTLIAGLPAQNISYVGDVMWRMVLMAIGMGLVMAPATESIMGSLPRAKAGVGSAVNDTTRQVGGALGVAVVGSVMTSVVRLAASRPRSRDPVRPSVPRSVDSAKEGLGPGVPDRGAGAGDRAAAVDRRRSRTRS